MGLIYGSGIIYINLNRIYWLINAIIWTTASLNIYEVSAKVGTYISLIYVDVITYPPSSPGAGVDSQR